MAWLVDDGEVLHLKLAGAVRVEKCWRADAIGTDHGLETGERDIEAGWLGGLRSEETELDFRLMSGIGGEGERYNSSLRRVRCQFELKKLE